MSNSTNRRDANKLAKERKELETQHRIMLGQWYYGPNIPKGTSPLQEIKIRDEYVCEDYKPAG